MKYSKININDIANGEGVNLSFWTQGCPHHCIGCFNKETWDFDGGKDYDSKTFDYICENIDVNGINRNLSILGGEPLCSENIVGVWKLCRDFKSKYPDRKIYLWTGYTMEYFTDNQKKVLHYIDILVDGKFEEDRKNLSLKLRGSSNQRVIDVRKSMKDKKIILWGE